MEFNTKLLHGKAVKKYADGATLPQISQVSAFQYDSAEEQDKVFHHKAAGFAYSRVANPTVAAFEQRINEMEGGNAAIACSSGMFAITLALLNMLCTGDEIIAGSGLYGGSIDLFEDLTKFGITTRFVPHMTVEAIKPLINEKTKVIYGEVICNPGLDVMDIRAVADLAHEHGIPLIVDSTTATPLLVNPIAFGADIVVHSTTKYINGSGNSIGGVIIDSARFNWDFDKFRALDGYRQFGKFAYTIRLRTDIWDNMGGCMAPMTAFLNVVGLETLGLRMERICDNADKLAHALAKIPCIDVNYPTLNPSHDLVQTQLSGRGGGILTFRVGSRKRAFKVLNSLQYAIRATSLGDVRTLVIHPASTLYIRSTQEQREAAGVFDDTIRVSVGIEDADDLIEDFVRAIASSAGL
ncbi:MAG: O-acetylhomoserine aminocarboxypropyltransferase/cysteine synthase [Oscillospiraceae bacterium]|nr:O-acetylhomoserine aminocarboxypropyltransferase/cysteine synthase [Oscillospiraceae bacterium]